MAVIKASGYGHGALEKLIRFWKAPAGWQSLPEEYVSAGGMPGLGVGSRCSGEAEVWCSQDLAVTVHGPDRRYSGQRSHGLKT